MIITDEALILERRLLELMDVIAKDLRCNRGSLEANKPRFVGVSIVLCGEYLQLLSVLS